MSTPARSPVRANQRARRCRSRCPGWSPGTRPLCRIAGSLSQWEQEPRAREIRRAADWPTLPCPGTADTSPARRVCVANKTLLLLLLPSRASSVRVLLPLLLSAIRLRHAPNQRRRAVVPCVGSSHSCASNGAGLDPSDETPRLPVVANGPPHRAGVFPAAARHHQCSALLCSAITNGSLPGRHNCGPTQTLI